MNELQSKRIIRLISLSENVERPYICTRRLRTPATQKISREDPNVGRQLQQIDHLHKKLNGAVDEMNEMIINGIQDTQDDLLLAYKLDMEKVEEDYEQINQKIKEEQQTHVIEKGIDDVRKELQWFKNEALRLFKEHEEQSAYISKMKLTLGLLKEEKDYFQNEVAQSHKVNKELAMRVNQYKVNFPQLYLTERKSQSATKTESNEAIEDWVSEELADIGSARASRKELSPFTNSERLTQLISENKLLNKKVQESIDSIHSYRKQIDKVLKEEHQVRGEKVKKTAKSKELKEFYLSCIEEAKRGKIYNNHIKASIKPTTMKPRSRKILSMEFKESQATDAKTSRESEKEYFLIVILGK